MSASKRLKPSRTITSESLLDERMSSPAIGPLDIPSIQTEYVVPLHLEANGKPVRQKGLGDVLVISGGSGYNELVGATPGATFVMPISDDGGSSSEIIRVLGGPSIGDLRSRLVRLIPTSSSYHGEKPPASNDALHALLSYRLPVTGKSRDIKQEWMDILEGRHKLWRGIESERKECIRGFLVYFESEILRRVHRNFSFRGASIGNFFLAAAQKFFRSIQSAIFLFSATALIPLSGGKVLPVINTNHTATIAAVLQDGQVIVGQCEISHPAKREAKNADEHQRLSRRKAYLSGTHTPSSQIFDPFSTAASSSSRLTVGNVGDGLDPGSESDVDGEDEDDENSDGNTGGRGSLTSTSLQEPIPKRQKRVNNIVFSKMEHSTSTNNTGSEHAPSDKLPSKISRLFYVNAYGNEVDPAPNPEYLTRLNQCQTVLYSCGSLWTSIVPCIALRGVATAISTSVNLQYKILLLNTTHDRETSGLEAMDFVKVLTESMRHCDQLDSLPVSKVVTHIIYSPQGRIPINVEQMQREGIQCVPVDLPSAQLRFEEESVKAALQKIAGDV
ncbi:UPF0052-domain-containing protein [Meira miltonrushii]|uniref:UPF0052-domain-containing protein n=1 Tax=Meira miltonrushii TaxID=1280837 RepID=A0A316V3H3_9BASI|nr:UPF0052-domain-containing protein [Meira miltonrushii]PWN31804.1 UPF0052-domain-containing protein [Meira miltonrushii]